jgi:acetate kinase
MRQVHHLADQGDKQARLALDMYCYRITKYIGAYYAILGGLDVLVFTAGVGENDALIRASICNKLSVLDIALDQQHNQTNTNESCNISATSSKVEVLVIPSNEELAIARQALTVLEQCDTG